MESTNERLWHKKTPLAIALIHALYELPNCSTGGIAHVIVDDENVRDSDLKWEIERINSDDEWYSEALEKDLVKLLCETLMEMSYEQRLAIFEIMMVGLGADDEDSYKYYEETISDRVHSNMDE